MKTKRRTSLAPERFSLRGRVVLLTGGAGIYGRGLTRDLAESGCRLVIASRDRGKLEAVARAERRRGFDVVAETLDQADESSVLALRERLLGRHGRIDGLVNNAVLRPMKGWRDAIANWRESLRVNADGLLLVTRAFGETMLRQGAGSIVNIGSTMGSVGPTFELYEGTTMGESLAPDYFFHKGGMLNFTRYFAACFGPAGVRVNCVSPGGMLTNQPASFLKRYAKKTALGRMAGDRDLGGAVIFLLSDASAYVTGANLAVDGGYTAL